MQKTSTIKIACKIRSEIIILQVSSKFIVGWSSEIYGREENRSSALFDIPLPNQKLLASNIFNIQNVKKRRNKYPRSFLLLILSSTY